MRLRRKNSDGKAGSGSTAAEVPEAPEADRTDPSADGDAAEADRGPGGTARRRASAQVEVAMVELGAEVALESHCPARVAAPAGTPLMLSVPYRVAALHGRPRGDNRLVLEVLQDGEVLERGEVHPGPTRFRNRARQGTLERRIIFDAPGERRIRFRVQAQSERRSRGTGQPLFLDRKTVEGELVVDVERI